MLRAGRVLLGISGLGLGFGGPGLCASDRLVPLLLRRGHLLLRGPLGLGGPFLRGLGLLLGGSLRRQRLGQLGIGLYRRGARLLGIGLGLFGTGPKPGPGLLCRRDLRFEPGPPGRRAGPG